MQTQKLIPIGRILAREQSYFLINPRPLQRDWEDEWTYRFEVVPFNDDLYTNVHKCPREVVFCCEFQVQYATDIPAIECELPYDILDREQEELITTEIGQ